MANEAVIIEKFGGHKGAPIRMACPDGTAIAKGALLFLEEPRTVSGVTGLAFAGIANTEKVASDGQTSIGLDTFGIYDLYSAACNAGALVALSGANQVRMATADDILSGLVVGKALETATNGETIAVAVGVY